MVIFSEIQHPQWGWIHSGVESTALVSVCVSIHCVMWVGEKQIKYFVSPMKGEWMFVRSLFAAPEESVIFIWISLYNHIVLLNSVTTQMLLRSIKKSSLGAENSE